MNSSTIDLDNEPLQRILWYVCFAPTAPQSWAAFLDADSFISAFPFSFSDHSAKACTPSLSAFCNDAIVTLSTGMHLCLRENHYVCPGTKSGTLLSRGNLFNLLEMYLGRQCTQRKEKYKIKASDMEDLNDNVLLLFLYSDYTDINWNV